jgi:hypothetical protein
MKGGEAYATPVEKARVGRRPKRTSDIETSNDEGERARIAMSRFAAGSGLHLEFCGYRLRDMPF